MGIGNYILRSDRDNFIKAGLQEDGLHTYHGMVLAVLQGEGARRNLQVHIG